ncbi:MAG: hypothetical protein CR989_01005 [Flavobacteriales bacterium]|nr:MAG: hypothetical protein CR989_01005 [Flavobacteriales bacterium]
MKNIIIPLFTLAICTLCTGQTLKVTYSETIDLSEKLKSIDDPMVRQIVKTKTEKPKYYELVSQKGISIYQLKSEENANTGTTVINSGSSAIVYRDHNTGTFTKQIDFLSRTFLIDDKLPKNDWKIGDEITKIGEYTCKKATLQKGNNTIEAWFTDEIPSNEGPKSYFGLPGLVLKVQTGDITIEATDISFSKEKINIEKPTKGKKITQVEFDKIKEEKIKGLTGGNKKNNGVQVIKM